MSISPDDIRALTSEPYERDVLNYHLHRPDFRGTALFDSGPKRKEVDLAAAVFHLEFPKINGRLDAILELRQTAQKHGIGSFWEMIEEHSQFAEAKDEKSLARAERIRMDFKKWAEDLRQLRAKTEFLLLLTTLVWFDSKWLIPAAAATMNWIGDANRIWIQSKERDGQAFRFLHRVDKKIKRLGRK